MSCQAIKLNGQPCTFKALSHFGSNYCGHHGGKNKGILLKCGAILNNGVVNCSFNANVKYGSHFCGIHKHLYTPPAPEPIPTPAPEPIPEPIPTPAPTVEPEVVQHVKSLLSNAMLDSGLFTPSAISTILEVKAPPHTLKVVQYTEDEACKYLKKMNWNKLEDSIEPMYVCMRRARETMDDEQLEIFEKNPRANVHIEEQCMEEYMTYRRGINYYYEAIIPILNKYRKDKKKKDLYCAIAWNNFFTNEIHNSIINNQDIYWNRKMYNCIIEIIN